MRASFGRTRRWKSARSSVPFLCGSTRADCDRIDPAKASSFEGVAGVADCRSRLRYLGPASGKPGEPQACVRDVSGDPPYRITRPVQPLRLVAKCDLRSFERNFGCSTLISVNLCSPYFGICNNLIKKSYVLTL